MKEHVHLSQRSPIAKMLSLSARIDSADRPRFPVPIRVGPGVIYANDGRSVSMALFAPESFLKREEDGHVDEWFGTAAADTAEPLLRLVQDMRAELLDQRPPIRSSATSLRDSGLYELETTLRAARHRQQDDVKIMQTFSARSVGAGDEYTTRAAWFGISDVLRAIKLVSTGHAGNLVRVAIGRGNAPPSSMRLAKSRIFHPVLAFYSEIDQTFSMLVWVWPKGTERERWTPDFMRVAIELPGVT